MYCGKCGNKMPDGTAFCGKCGNRITTEAKGSTPPAKEIPFRAPVPRRKPVPVAAAGKNTRIIGFAAAALQLLQIVLFFVPFYQLRKDILPPGSSGTLTVELAAAKSLFAVMTEGADGIFCYLTLAALLCAALLALVHTLAPKISSKLFTIFPIAVAAWMLFLLRQFSSISIRYATTAALTLATIAALLTLACTLVSLFLSRKHA